MPSNISLKKAVESLEKELIVKAMEENNWVISKAARQLDITDRILSYKIKKYWKKYWKKSVKEELVMVCEQIQKVVQEMERARADNLYDMAGHGTRAQEYLRQAERELQESIEATKREKQFL